MVLQGKYNLILFSLGTVNLFFHKEKFQRNRSVLFKWQKIKQIYIFALRFFTGGVHKYYLLKKTICTDKM